MNSISMTLNADELILSALKEDISSEDVSTNAVMPDFVYLIQGRLLLFYILAAVMLVFIAFIIISIIFPKVK